MDQDALLNLIKSRLASSREVGALDIHIEIEDGQVRLHGEADSRQQRNAAARIAREASGVRQVINNLRIREFQGPGRHHERITATERRCEE